MFSSKLESKSMNYAVGAMGREGLCMCFPLGEVQIFYMICGGVLGDDGESGVATTRCSNVVVAREVAVAVGFGVSIKRVVQGEFKVHQLDLH